MVDDERDPRPDSDKVTRSLVPSLGEVPDRGTAEENLTISSDQRLMLHSIFDGISQLAYVVDLDSHQLIYVHKELDQLFGPDAGSRKCYELFRCQVPCQTCPQLGLSATGGGPETWERYDEAHDRHYLAEKKELDWPDGRIIRAAFVSDVTDQRKAEKALRISNEALQRLNASMEAEITDRKAAQEALRQQAEEFRLKALYDTLTGLPNRAQFNERLALEMQRASQGQTAGSVLFIDLDDLKTVNDTFGHRQGDALIILAGALILAEVGNSAFVARIGGDEFIVILSGKSSRKAVAKIADGIVKALRYEYNALGTQVQMTASVGIAVYPEDGDTPEEIFKNADNAMYAAKHAGKSRWRFYEKTMQDEAYEKVVLTSSLRTAIGRGELSVVYQPQIAAENHAVSGFEALLRWNSSRHGPVSPVRFIPLAEQGGLIQSIGQWVLQEACRFARKLADLGQSGIRVGVNVSPHQLSGEDFGDVVRQIIDSVDIKPSQLELEITESALMSSLDNTVRNLEQLNALGVRLSLDDFGTGYSSLTYLHRLPVKALKIDKSFIDKIMVDNSYFALINSIVYMAHSMEMTVVAEGVETRQQLDFLTGIRCDLIQGYYFSRPLSADNAIQFLSHEGKINECG
ncbi:MAG: EAL domain-containing protein [Negativicutes bacterium]|nr:EAL domain-containing protein [Negativicutes bacterium]